MDILVIGAGVLGSLYAAKLQQAGNAVTVLSRGNRAKEIQENGIILVDAASGEQTITPVKVVTAIDPNIRYDLVLVLVRKNQVADLLPALANHQHTPNILFMVNNAAGPDELILALGRPRVLLGFPGAGGQREDGVVRYQLVSKGTQPTTIGEIDGMVSPRIKWIAETLENAGFPVELCSDMDAWLKTHVALVSPIANAIYLAGGDNYRLSRTRDGLVLLVRAVREGLMVLRRLGYPVTPAKYRVLEYIPEPVLVWALKLGMNTERAELVMARHANHARDEMTQVYKEFKQLAFDSGLPTPAIDSLGSYLDETAPTVADGSSVLSVNYRGLFMGAALLTASALTLGWALRGKRNDCK